MKLRHTLVLLTMAAFLASLEVSAQSNDHNPLVEATKRTDVSERQRMLS